MAIIDPIEPARTGPSADRANGDNPRLAAIRAQRRRRRLERMAAEKEAESNVVLPLSAPEHPLVPEVDPSDLSRDLDIADGGIEEKSAQPEIRPARHIPWTSLSFLFMVIIPTVVTAFYYIYWASPQYQVETQYSVRGSGGSSISTLGLSGLFGGNTVENSDSYIVASYVESLQLIIDIKKQLGIDLRQYYVRDDIDFVYRIKPDMPLEKFTQYWQSMTDVSFNSTTGNITMYVYAFSAEDAKAIADAVLKASETLVNNLSESNRQQLMLVASKQVDRSEERLRKVREQIRNARIDQGQTDYEAIIAQQNKLVGGMREKLSELETRYSALVQNVDENSPNAKVMRGQIDALKRQLKLQEAELGSDPAGTNDGAVPDPNGKTSRDGKVADSLTKFEELTIEQKFATEAYTTSLAAFETAIAEAQKQERYFATFVKPVRPEIAMYPLRWLDSFIAFLVLLAFWMMSQFLFRSFRDHAI